MTRRDDLIETFRRAGFVAAAAPLADIALGWMARPEQIEAMAKAYRDPPSGFTDVEARIQDAVAALGGQNVKA